MVITIGGAISTSPCFSTHHPGAPEPVSLIAGPLPHAAPLTPTVLLIKRKSFIRLTLI
jgi:hypothetical protein